MYEKDLENNSLPKKKTFLISHSLTTPLLLLNGSKGAWLVPIRTDHYLDKVETAFRNFEGKCLEDLL